MTVALEKPERPMSVPIAMPIAPYAKPLGARAHQPLPSHQAIAKARWIAESDPRVEVAVRRKDVLVSAFVSAPHARSGGWTLGIRYMADTRGSLELLVSVVVDLFAGELVSLVTFESMTGSGGW